MTAQSLSIACLAVLGLAACSASPTPTAVPPTLTLALPTATVALASPTARLQPTSTPIPPSATPLQPTATALPRATQILRSVTIKEITNLVETRASSNASFVRAGLGQALTVGGQLRLGDSSQVRLDFGDGTIFRLGQNTSLTIEQLAEPDAVALWRFQLGSGKAWMALPTGVLEIRTGVGSATVRGAFATVEVFPNGDVVFLLLQGNGRFVRAGATALDSCARSDPCRNLTNRSGVSVRDNQFADYALSLEALEDYCAFMVESCKPLANALGIRITDIFLTRTTKESAD